jgi:hypothetical protein
MLRYIVNSCLVVILIVSLVTPVSLVAADETYTSTSQTGTSVGEVEQEVTGEAMLADLVFLRPAGFVGLVLGTATFVASLIFTVPMQQVGEASRKLVVEPAKYTFARPLGQPHGE